MKALLSAVAAAILLGCAEDEADDALTCADFHQAVHTCIASNAGNDDVSLFFCTYGCMASGQPCAVGMHAEAGPNVAFKRALNDDCTWYLSEENACVETLMSEGRDYNQARNAVMNGCYTYFVTPDPSVLAHCARRPSLSNAIAEEEVCLNN